MTLLKSYYQLCKPNVVYMMLICAFVGMLLAEQTVSSYSYLFIALTGIALCAASAAAINQVVDREADASMTRTDQRPLPKGDLSVMHASIFAFVIGLLGSMILYLYVNTLTMILTIGSLIGYALIYTVYLKRATPQNIVIGGAAGAFPPVIGWTISMGSLSLEPLTFFLIIFFWTPSHFWALSLYKSDDYKKAKLPMLPLTNGVESTKLNIFIYSLLMVPVIIFPFLIDFVGLAFLIPSLMLTFYYNYLCYQLFNFKKDRFNPKIAKTIFGYSILYLFLIFVLFLIDKIV